MVDVDEKGLIAYATAIGAGRLCAIPLVGDDEVRTLLQEYLPGGARPIGVLPGPDGKVVCVANRGLNHIAVVDVASWEVTRRLPAGAGPDGMAFSRIGD